MANPFLGAGSTHTPTSITDPVGDDIYFGGTHYTIAGFLVVALVILVGLHLSGLHAMVGIGRG